ncbi:hypothetical protein RB195_005956 [Necator americanus]|uniref:Uncharacterized protein n=1 Tax=Necator americanus TaxID=51031 RepID=A0ABR1BTG3_NECAM
MPDKGVCPVRPALRERERSGWRRRVFISRALDDGEQQLLSTENFHTGSVSPRETHASTASLKRAGNFCSPPSPWNLEDENSRLGGTISMCRTELTFFFGRQRIKSMCD